MGGVGAGGGWQEVWTWLIEMLEDFLLAGFRKRKREVGRKIGRERDCASPELLSMMDVLVVVVLVMDGGDVTRWLMRNGKGILLLSLTSCDWPWKSFGFCLAFLTDEIAFRIAACKERQHQSVDIHRGLMSSEGDCSSVDSIC